MDTAQSSSATRRPTWRPRWGRIALALAAIPALWVYHRLTRPLDLLDLETGHLALCRAMAREIPRMVAESPSGVRGVRVVDVVDIEEYGENGCIASVEMNVTSRTADFSLHRNGDKAFINLTWHGGAP